MLEVNANVSFENLMTTMCSGGFSSVSSSFEDILVYAIVLLLTLLLLS
jgi:hypothetical protein